MDWKAALVDLIPSRLATVILLLSLPLSTAPYYLPESLWSDLALSEHTLQWLIELEAQLVLLLIGICVSLLIIIHHYTRGKGQDKIADRVLKVRAERNRQLLAQNALLSKLGK